MNMKIRPFDGKLLDEIISIFNNNVVICGSLLDYLYIDHATISDFDFIVDKSVFLKFFNLSDFENEIRMNNFSLKKKKITTFERISYAGRYKENTVVDFYVKDQLVAETDVLVASSLFTDNSKYETYMVNNVATRKKRLNELFVIASSTADVSENWILEWRKKKLQQINEKLPLYNKKFPMTKNDILHI